MSKNRRDFFRITASSALGTALLPAVHFGRDETETGAESREVKSKVEEALALFKKHNCCQSVLVAFAPELGMDKITALRAAQGMPGIGGLGNVCGTVSGATLVIGLKTMNENNIDDPQAKKRTSETVREFVARFEKRHSSIKCRELIGHDISTPEKIQAALKDKAFANCPNFVGTAVEILEELFS